MHDALLLAGAAYGDDQLDDARAHAERAFRELRDAGDLRGAARAASMLAELHHGALGNHAAGRGWLARAEALLDEIGPCVERGYWELALMACDRHDVDDLASSAARALDIARAHGDPALEARALADGGVAMVSQGHVDDGFVMIDQALACLGSGEIADPYVIGTALCSVLTACDRAGDVERAGESVRLVEQLVLDASGGRPRVLGTHCKVALGGVLCTVGRFDEAESTLAAALGPDGSASSVHRVQATARLAELRIAHGRVDEAAELLAPIEDAVVAAGPLAAVHLARGDAAVAAAVLRRAVSRLTGDVLRSAPLLAALVEADLARGDRTAAADAANLLRSMANVVSTALVRSLASLADARVALADHRTTDAVAAFEAATDALGPEERPLLAATITVELADAHAAAGDESAAIACARAALAAAQRVGARAVADRSAAVLRSLGVATPRRAPAATVLAGLTAREAEVLDGMRRGDTNAEIAARLYLSPKTVEHHVGRILAKLGVRTRAEAAAVAASVTP